VSDPVNHYNAGVTWIIEEIERRGGAISFRSFMELALYHPEHGYYASTTPRYGRSGDFLTAPTASSWYARVFSDLLRRLADHVGPVVLVDVGAGEGSLVKGVIDSIGGDPHGVVRRVVTVERSPAMTRIQSERMRGVGVPRELVDDVASLQASAAGDGGRLAPIWFGTLRITVSSWVRDRLRT